VTPRSKSWLVAPNTARFCHPRANPASLPPFPAYISQPTPTGLLPPGFPIRPLYSTRNGRACVELLNTRPASLYATGEQAGPLLRNNTRKTLWNTDSYDYTDKTESLYQSHPFILGLRPNSAPSFGIIIETTYRCALDLHPSRGSIGMTVETDGPPPAITIILRDSPQDVIKALTDLTGRMPLPPLWALGYHQCRYSYMSADEVRAVAKGFRDRHIPCDALWLDIDYMDGYRSFTFNKEDFPNPAKLISDLHNDNFKVVAMIDPGLKVDETYEPYVDGRDQGHFVTTRSPSAHAEGVAESSRPGVASQQPDQSAIQNPQSTIYQAPVWPGPCAFPDFTRAAARQWFGDLYRPLLTLGIDGFWNDMNEPAIFVPSKTMPLDTHHDADEDLGGPAPHARYHNIYGAQMARATHDALIRHRPDRRPFILTRSAFLGSQRHAATWTGDNRADQNHLRWSIPMALNLGLSGQPFCGPDIGGFLGNTDPDLFARWMAIGALLPFCRSHKNKGTKPHEPWALGPDCEQACRTALERRYQLLPYLYTLFHEAAITGLPIARPLFFADPTDPRLRSIDDAFLLGDALLVQTNITSPKPRGNWLPFEIPLRACGGGGRVFETGGGRSPSAHAEGVPSGPAPAAAGPRSGGGVFLHVRAGHAIPLAPITQHTGEPALDLTLLAALDTQGQATATLYEDAGEGFSYQQGDYTLTTFRITRDAPCIEVFSTKGTRPPPQRHLEVVIL
jgi:alpha-glucosidase